MCLNSVPVMMIIVILIVALVACLGLPQHEIVFEEDDETYQSDTTCISPNGLPGHCVGIDNCNKLLSLIHDSSKRDFLAQSQCGWEEANKPKVCCEDEPPKAPEGNCTTPDNRPGHCISLMDCVPIKSLLLKPTQDTSATIRNLRCGTGKFDVCCSISFEGQHPTFEYRSAGDQCTPQSTPYNPSSQCCGQRSGVEDRIMQSEVASIDQFPWAAAIEYDNNGYIEMNCGGSLISGRYVLSAAHCFYQYMMKPVNVRLGEFNTENTGPDCVAANGGGSDCTNRTVTIAIEHIIIHPDYYSDSPSKPHDIALIRLAETAPYTEFIRPICLPTSDFTETADTNTMLVAAGWGIYDETQQSSRLLRFTSLPYIQKEHCFLVYLRKNATLGNGQICAGGTEGKDTCNGDSGSALMLERSSYTEVVGITSFGFIDCGKKRRPAVYTKVYHYLTWIRNNIY